MSGTNGHADARAVSAANQTVLISDSPIPQAATSFPPEKIRQLVSELEVPFDQGVIEWRVTNTAKGEQRGQIVPYANTRAYTDRLNVLFTPAGWTRKYTVNTSANFERAKDKKLVAKVLVTCELTIFGVGSHSATGEEFADNENALTAAEAQAFKRASACYGLGRYLYHFTGIWVDLDERKRPKTIPRLFGWATPEGWRQGLRPGQVTASHTTKPAPSTEGNESARTDNRDEANRDADFLVGQIDAMASRLGRRLYRGVLKSVARVWNATEIQDRDVLSRVLGEMQAAERGLRRLDESLKRVEPGTLTSVLRSLRLNSLDQVDSLDALKRVVFGVERTTGTQQ